MDAYLALMSKRDSRRYAERSIPEALVLRILDAGRLAGSSRNRQPWRFVLVEDQGLRRRLSELVYRPENVRAAALVVAVVVSGSGPTAFDAGRAAERMMLAAWNEGVVSCPNGMPDAAKAHALLGLREGERLAIVLSFGFPVRARDPARRQPEEWIARADRKPLEEVVARL